MGLFDKLFNIFKTEEEKSNNASIEEKIEPQSAEVEEIPVPVFEETEEQETTETGDASTEQGTLTAEEVEDNKEEIPQTLEYTETKVELPAQVEKEKNPVKQEATLSVEQQFEEAMRCYEGEGVEKDEAKARRLFAQASQQGHIPSKVMLGVCYMLGQGIAQNKAVARSLFAEAAEKGNAVGMRFLANAILESEPKPEDMEQVFKLYEKSAAIGDPVSCEWLADRYSRGENCVRNERKAAELYQKAANAGNLNAEYKLASYIIQKDKEKLPEAVKIMEHLVEVGFPDAVYALGTLYYTGTGVEEDFAKGADLIKKAADMGDPRAQDLLGRWCSDGELYKPDYESAVHWFEDAAKKNYAPAQVNLGKLYLEGKGVPQNIFEAANLFYMAGMDGYVEGMQCLMQCYRQYYVPVYGDGDNGTDIAWLEKAASFNFQVPMYKLGLAYLEGNGVAQDIDKGMELLVVSAMLGYGEAMYTAAIILLKGEIVPRDPNQALFFLQQAAVGDVEDKIHEGAVKLLEHLKADK